MSFRAKLREIATYHSDDGTSGYLLSEKQIDQIIELVKKEIVGEKEDLSEDIKDVDYSLTLQQLNMEKVRQTVTKSHRNELRAEQRQKLEEVEGK